MLIGFVNDFRTAEKLLNSIKKCFIHYVLDNDLSMAFLYAIRIIDFHQQACTACLLMKRKLTFYGAKQHFPEKRRTGARSWPCISPLNQEGNNRARILYQGERRLDFIYYTRKSHLSESYSEQLISLLLNWKMHATEYQAVLYERCAGNTPMNIFKCKTHTRVIWYKIRAASV